MPLPERPRLFVGLSCPEEWAGRLVRAHAPALGTGPGPAAGAGDSPTDGAPWRAYAAPDLHLTLCFLGAFPRDGVPALVRALEEELRGLSAPELRVEGVGAFPDRRAPRVLYAGVHEDADSVGRLAALQDRVRQACLSQGWREGAADRRRGFRPHVTLARSRGRAPGPVGTLEALERVQFSRSWLPVEVTLFHSTPETPEARHHALAAVPLVVRPG